VNTEDIASALRIMVGGDYRVTRFRDETMNEDYDVQVRLKLDDRNDAATIARLFVPRQNATCPPRQPGEDRPDENRVAH